MTREELLQMPISQLRGLDTTSIEMEKLVQEVLNEKLQNEPRPSTVVLHPQETDNLTPQKEAELQAQIDESRKPVVESGTDNQTIPTEVVSKPFCAFCTAKGPISHKKSCTRPRS